MWWGERGRKQKKGTPSFSAGSLLFARKSRSPGGRTRAVFIMADFKAPGQHQIGMWHKYWIEGPAGFLAYAAHGSGPFILGRSFAAAAGNDPGRSCKISLHLLIIRLQLVETMWKSSGSPMLMHELLPLPQASSIAMMEKPNQLQTVWQS